MSSCFNDIITDSIRNITYEIFKYLKEYRQHYPAETLLPAKYWFSNAPCALPRDFQFSAPRNGGIDIGDRAVEYFVNIFAAAHPRR